MLDLKFKPGPLSQLLEEHTCVHTQLLAWKLSMTRRGGRMHGRTAMRHHAGRRAGPVACASGKQESARGKGADEDRNESTSRNQSEVVTLSPANRVIQSY